MKKLFNYIIVFILGVISSYIVSNYYFPPKEVTIIKYKTVTDTKYVNVPKIKWIIKPNDTIIIKDTIVFIDTCKKLMVEYNTIKSYSDTLSFDSLGNCVLNTYISRNNLDSLNYKYNIYIPEKTVKKFENNNNNLYISTLIGDGIFTPMIGLDRNNYLIGIGYNLNSSSLVFNLTYKIKWKKH